MSNIKSLSKRYNYRSYNPSRPFALPAEKLKTEMPYSVFYLKGRYFIVNIILRV